VSIAEARRRRRTLGWVGYTPPRPSFTGVRVLDPYPLEEIIPFIDWSPFFHTWELKGTYPRIFENPEWGERARELFDDARALLARLASEKRLHARATYGFFPAGAVGDDIAIYADESRSRVLATVHTLRQQTDKPVDQPAEALADLVAPRDTGVADYLGAFAVTAGLGMEPLLAEYARDHDDYGSILLKAVADRLAEGLAEALHRRVREEWGYGLGESLGPEDLIRERYRGIRPAPGYPACPDHTEKRTLFDLLGGEAHTGIQLTDSFAMFPASSVSGWYFSHPESRYFQVGRIGHDQVQDYARRKGIPLPEAERWLAPNLDYEPAPAAGGPVAAAPSVPVLG
jgi:5-methyltetrahydrofolate--homocysteine methyltransferase